MRNVLYNNEYSFASCMYHRVIIAATDFPLGTRVVEYINTSVEARYNNGFKYRCILYVNPLWTKFFFRRFSGHSLKGPIHAQAV